MRNGQTETLLSFVYSLPTKLGKSESVRAGPLSVLLSKRAPSLQLSPAHENEPTARREWLKATPSLSFAVFIAAAWFLLRPGTCLCGVDCYRTHLKSDPISVY